MSEWVSIEERLPKTADDYIVTDGLSVWTLFFSTGYWYPPATNLTHWMPLPDPPAAGGKRE